MRPRPDGWGQAFVDGQETIRRWFADAGFPGARIDSLTAVVDLPPVRAFVPQHPRALPWSAAFASLESDDKAAMLASIDASIDEYRTGRWLLSTVHVVPCER